MTILLIVRWPVGGIRTFLNYVYGQWPDAEAKFHILTPNLPEVTVLKEQLREVNITWHATTSASPSFYEFLGKVNKITRTFTFDLIHAHGFTSALSVGWELPFLKTRSIFTSHDVITKKQLTGIKGFFKRLLMAIVLNRFSVIQSVSFDAQLNLLQELPLIKQNRLKVISNGVDTRKFYGSHYFNLKKELCLDENVVLVGFFGRFMSQKGFTYLVSAAELLNASYPGKYHIACFGSGAFIREEKIDIEKRGISHMFHFHDLVPNIAPYVKGCDLVAMPSLWEACGLVAMEVLSAGTPLVAANCIGLREVCHGTPAVLVDPGSAKSLEQGILECEAIPKETFRLYSESASERFDVATTRSHFFQLYQSLSQL